MDSNRADILSSKALALYALEKYEKALNYCNKAIKNRY